MSKKARGIFDLKTKKKTYQFQLSTNAICDVEHELQKTWPQLLNQLSSPEGIGMTELRVIFWAGISQFDEEVTIKDIGKIIDEIGLANINKIFTEGVEHTLQTDEDEEEEQKGNGKAKTKEGKASKNPPAAQETSPSS